jgi:ankyrin repeat protein
MAVKNGRVDAIKALAELGADVNAPYPAGLTPVHVATRYGYEEAIKALAELGVDVNKRDSDGCTPVLVAVLFGHVGVIKALAELGADVNTPNQTGITPVLAAAHFGHVGAIKLLYKLGADMKPTSFVSSITEVAQEDNRTEALQLIVKIHNKLINECEFCGCSSKRLKVCSKCEKVRYCSRECQVQDYKTHKNECISPLR